MQRAHRQPGILEHLIRAQKRRWSQSSYYIILTHFVASGFVQQRSIKSARRGFHFISQHGRTRELSCTNQPSDYTWQFFLTWFLKNPFCFPENEPFVIVNRYCFVSSQMCVRFSSAKCQVVMLPGKASYLAQWWRTYWCSWTWLFFFLIVIFYFFFKSISQVCLCVLQIHDRKLNSVHTV